MNRYARQATNQKVVQEIRKTLAETGTCLFLEGSRLAVDGASEDEPKAPGWAEWLRSMVRWCIEAELCEADEVEAFEQLLQSGMRQDAGQELHEIFSEPAQRLLCVTETAGDRGVLDIHRAVVQCGFRSYLSMTLDQSIEEAYAAEIGEPLTKRFASDNLSDAVQSQQTKGTPFLLKLRGDTSHGPSIRLNAGHPAATADTSDDCQTALEALVKTSPALLAGFSTEEPELQALLDRVGAFRRTDGAPKRWLLARAGEIPPLKAKRLTLDYGLSILEYQPRELLPFLAGLAAEEPAPVIVLERDKPSVRDMIPAIIYEPAAGPLFKEESATAPVVLTGHKQAPLQVFTAYAHEDAKYRELLGGQFWGMVEDGLIRMWYDREILPGEDWHNVIEEKLNSADLILLLFSEHFFRSSYCRGVELQRAKERREAGEAELIGIMVTEVDVGNELRRLQLLPPGEGGKRLTIGANAHGHRARNKVAAEIRRLVEHLVGAEKRL